mmetsp:Transcript_26051/g.42694  ORF Transcript_26051/g.42694 Transcript_26051/m.42694 type:complete len:184 (+) Transcript_26051:215-766(+)
MCLYGSWMVARIIASLWRSSDDGSSTTSTITTTTTTTLVIQMGVLWIVLASAGVTLTVFSSFHVYLIATNQTTTEYYKRKALRTSSSHNILCPIHVHEQHGNGTINTTSTIVCNNSDSTERHIRNGRHDEESADKDVVVLDDPTTTSCTCVGLATSNAYDLGFLDNVLEVVFPRSLYQRRKDD